MATTQAITEPAARDESALDQPPTSSTTGAPSARIAARLPARAAAILLPLGAALMTVSVPIDPPPEGPEPRGTIAAYAAEPERMDIAATILHNGFLLFGIGLLLAGFSVGRRGRLLAVVGGLAGGIGLLDLSGAVLVDWFHSAAGREFGVEGAVRMTELADMPVVTAGWFIPMALGAAIGPFLLLAGLARARVVGWWILAFPVAIVVLISSGLVTGPLAGGLGFGIAALLGLVLGVALWRASGTEPTRA